MAVTRINNNQITTATAGNAIVGINAAAKLQNYSITSTKIANNLTYGSDLTVSGNLTVNGTTTTIDTVNTLIQDPIVTLADGQTAGSPTVDIGLLGLRGSQNSSFIGWKESGTTFMAILSNTTVSNTTVNVTSYANFTASTITAQANLSVIGNIVGAANFTGNVTAGNVLTPGIMSSTGNITSGNILTGGILSAGGNATVGNISATNHTGTNVSVTGIVTAASVVGGVMTGTSLSVSGNITAGNISANIIGNIDAAGSNTQVQFNDTTDILGASAGFTFNKVGNILTANGNINGANVSTVGTVTAASTVGGIITGTSTSVTGTTTAASVVGGVITGSSTSVTGTTTAASVVGGVMTGSSVSVTGNVSGAIVNTPSVVGATVTISTTSNGAISLAPNGTGNVSLNSRYINSLADPVQDQDAATKIYVDTVATGLDPKASVLAATANTLAVYSGGTVSYNNGTAGVGANLVTTGTYLLIDGSNVQTANTRVLVKNEANATWNGIYVWSNATVLTRASDFNQPAEVPSAFTFVETGTTNADTGWVCTTNAPVTFGTTNIVFTQFSGAGSYTAGNALSLSGTQFNVNIDTSGNTTVGINGSNELYIPTGAKITNPNITAATGTSVSVTGTVTAASVVGGVITGTSTSVTGTTTAASVVGGVITGSSTSVTGTTTAASVVGGVITGSSTSVTGTTTAASVVGGVMTGSSLSVTGNVTGGNVLFGSGIVSGTGNISGGNVLTGGLISATANVTAGNVITTGTLAAGNTTITGFANVSNGVISIGSYVGANITDGIIVDYVTGNGRISVGSADGINLYNGPQAGNTLLASFNTVGALTLGTTGTANITAGNALISGQVSATANVTGGNVLTAGQVSATGNGTFGNIVLTGNNINQLQANSIITVNGATANTNFAVNGSTANVFFINAANSTAAFGSNVTSVNALVSFNSTTSVLLPSGTTAQRPSNATSSTGMIRFNTTSNSLEIYNNSVWTGVGGTTFTVIADDQFNGDGTTVAFTLTSSQTTNSCIVSINGVVQIPTVAYSVSTTTLTFTEAPAVGDLIDVRELTTTTTVTAIQNNSGNATVTGNSTAAQVDVTGNLNMVTGFINVNFIQNAGANGTGNIGNATNSFNTIFAKATSAQYADLAEKYVADAEYAPGTVVSFGGEKEVTRSEVDADRAVAGVVSTNPSYIMNAGLEAEHVAVVAFTGRVPTSVTGTVAKGDLMVSNGDGTARADTDPKAGSIIGKALENFAGGTGTIEVVIGRF